MAIITVSITSNRNPSPENTTTISMLRTLSIISLTITVIINAIVAWIYYIICTHTTLKTLAIFASVIFIIIMEAVNNSNNSKEADLLYTSPVVIRIINNISIYFTLVVAILSWLYVCGEYENNRHMHYIIETICLIFAWFMTGFYIIAYIKGINNILFTPIQPQPLSSSSV